MRCSFLVGPLLALCFVSIADAADVPSPSIKIDVGQFEGEWGLQNYNPLGQDHEPFLPAKNPDCKPVRDKSIPTFRGSCVFNAVVPGSYALVMPGNHGPSGFFSVKEDGTVTPTMDGYLLAGGLQLLKLKTREVKACLNGYAGKVGFENVITPKASSDKACNSTSAVTWRMPPGFKYKFGFAGMWVAESGGELFTDRPDIVFAVPGTLRLEFQTTKLDVHPAPKDLPETEWIVISEGDVVLPAHKGAAEVAVLKNIVSTFSAKPKTGYCSGLEFKLTDTFCSRNFVATGRCDSSVSGHEIKDYGDYVFKPICNLRVDVP